MKKFLLLLILFISTISIFGDVGKYEKISLLDKEVFFPKNIQDYLEDLRLSNDPNSFYSIALLSHRLKETEAAKKFLDEYSNHSNDYIKIANIYEKLGEFEKQIDYLKKDVKNKNIQSKIEVYNKIQEIINNNNLDPNLNIDKITKIDLLFTKDDEVEFYDYFQENSWSDEEISEILSRLEKIDIRNKSYLRDIFLVNAEDDRIINYFYDKIKDITDIKGYFQYFDVLYVFQEEFIWKTKIEKLYYLDYLNEAEKFKTLKDEIITNAIREDEYRLLYILYKAYEDFKMIYNLALYNQEYLEDLIKFVDDENVKKELLKEYEKIGEKSIFDVEELLDLKIKFSPIEQKFEIIDEILNERFERKYFNMKIELLRKNNQIEEAIETLKEVIFNKYEDEEYIELLIKLSDGIVSNKILYSDLKSLVDKRYLYEFCANKGYEVPTELEKDAIEYFLKNGHYDMLAQYSNLLNYEQFKKLLKLGRVEFLETAQKIFPTGEYWRRDEGLEFFYFDENFNKYNEVIVEKIKELDLKSSAEIYYLARYFNFIENYEKSQNYLMKLEDKYGYDENILDLYIRNIKGIEEKRDIEEQSEVKEEKSDKPLDEEIENIEESQKEKRIIKIPEINYFELENDRLH